MALISCNGPGRQVQCSWILGGDCAQRPEPRQPSPGLGGKVLDTTTFSWWSHQMVRRRAQVASHPFTALYVLYQQRETAVRSRPFQHRLPGVGGGPRPTDCPPAQPRFSRPSRASAWLLASGGSTGHVAGAPWTRSSGSMIPQRDVQNPGGAFLTVTVDEEAYSAATDGREARGRGGPGASCPLRVLLTQKLPEPLT